MNFNEYQKKAWETAIYPNKGNNIYYPALGLGEVGELQNIIKKVMRDNEGVVTIETRGKIFKELGDVLWYVGALCTEFNFNMQDVAEANIEKLFSRKERGVIKGSGDDR